MATIVSHNPSVRLGARPARVTRPGWTPDMKHVQEVRLNPRWTPPTWESNLTVEDKVMYTKIRRFLIAAKRDEALLELPRTHPTFTKIKKHATRAAVGFAHGLGKVTKFTLIGLEIFAITLGAGVDRVVEPVAPRSVGGKHKRKN